MKDSLMGRKCRYSESDMEFHSEQIEVVRGGKSKEPTSFIWKRKDYKIKEILESWADWGFPPGSPKKKSWRLRHHRNYYKIKTEDGKIFEIYFDRKTKKEEGEWVLYRKIN